MTRKTVDVVWAEEGRDKGKVFVISETSAWQAERWGWKLFMAMGRSNTHIPPEVTQLGVAGLFMLGLQGIASLREEDAIPLLEEMFDSCVGFCPDPNNRSIMRGVAPEGRTSVGPLVESDIEEIYTRLDLRRRIVELHASFSLAVLKSKLSEGTASQEP